MHQKIADCVRQSVFFLLFGDSNGRFTKYNAPFVRAFLYTEFAMSERYGVPTKLHSDFVGYRIRGPRKITQ